MKKLIALTSILLLLMSLSFVALADNNLCHTVWAGQCTTLRQWQAGHCYANEVAEVCDTMYSDVVSIGSGELADLSSAQANGATGQATGSQAQQSQQAQGRSLKPPQQQESSSTSPPQACRPSITSLGHNSWIGAFQATVNTCGRMFGGGGSGGKLLDSRKATNVATLGDTSCSISVSLYERTSDKSRSLYTITTASPSPCDSLSFWVSGS